MSPAVKTKADPILITLLLGELMEIKTKLFRWPDKGNHVIVIARGKLDLGGLEQIFREIAAAVQSASDYKVLIDLIDATYKINSTELDPFVDWLSSDLWPKSNKIAFVCSQKFYQELALLSHELSKRGFKIAAFYDSNIAVDWLATPI